MAELPLSMNDQSARVSAMLVANTVLGGGIKSRLFGRIRQKEGISYGVGSGFNAPALEQDRLNQLVCNVCTTKLRSPKSRSERGSRGLCEDGITAAELC